MAQRIPPRHDTAPAARGVAAHSPAATAQAQAAPAGSGTDGATAPGNPADAPGTTTGTPVDTSADARTAEDYAALGVDGALRELGTTADGLSAQEAARRLAACGPNALPEKRTSPVAAFLKRYWGPMPWLLELAAVLALVAGHATESLVIAVLLTVNAVIGQVQATDSARAVALLKAQLTARATVRRDGRWQRADTADLVPGDIVACRMGDLVPADCVVVDGAASLDTAALTGESTPRQAGPGSTALSGSTVTRGELRAVVARTGAGTYFGRTAALVQEARPASRQQRLLFDIVRYMMYAGVAGAAAVSAYALALGQDAVTVLSLVVTFLMGAVPVALPAVLTIVQAKGALDLSRRGVLVTRLDSVEDASAVDVFCFDKTGTITQNRLTVRAAQVQSRAGEKDLARLAALACADTAPDAIDQAVRAWAEALGAAGGAAQGERRAEGAAPGGDVGSALPAWAAYDPATWERTGFTPFSPETRRAEGTATHDGMTLHAVKGAPQAVLALTDADDAARAETLSTVRAWSESGWRALAVAASADSGPLRLAGLIALADPPRADSAALIAQLGDLGIRSVMLTGDDAAVARQVAREVGIGGRIRRAQELRGLPEEAQLRLVEDSDGFAEVYPEDKHAIVSLLQRAGHAVGMTGDGVNDAPALRQAELGCAVSGATDVARAAASAVLTKPGLGEILETVRVSRQTYQRMLTWVINKVVKVVEVVALFTLGYAWSQRMLVSLLGMSLLVFANDFATMSIATDNVTSTASPNGWELRRIVGASSALGLLFALEDLAFALVGHYVLGLGAEELSTLVMLVLVFNSQARILTVRERRHLWSSRPSAGMAVVAAATCAGFCALSVAGVGVAPIGAPVALGALGACAAGAVLLDLVKYALFRLFRVA